MVLLNRMSMTLIVASFFFFGKSKRGIKASTAISLCSIPINDQRPETVFSTKDYLKET